LQVVPLLLMPSSAPYLPSALLDLLVVKLSYVDPLTGARGKDIPYSVLGSLVEDALSMRPAAAAVAGHVSAPLGRMLRVRELLQQQQVRSSSGRGAMWGREEQQQLEQALAAAEGVDPRAVARQLGQRLVKSLQSAWQLVVAGQTQDSSSASFDRSTKVDVDHMVYRAAQLWRVSAGHLLAGCSVDYTADVLQYSTKGTSQYHCAAAWGVAADLQLPVAVQQDILNQMSATPYRGSGRWLVNWCQGMLTGKKGQRALPPASISQLLELVKAVLTERLMDSKSGRRSSSGSPGSILGDVSVAEVLGLAEVAAGQGAGGSAFDLVMHLLTAVDQDQGRPGASRSSPAPRLVRMIAESAFTCWLAAVGDEADGVAQQGVSSSTFAHAASSVSPGGAATGAAAGASAAGSASGGQGKGQQEAGDPLLPMAWVGTPALAQLLVWVGRRGLLAEVLRVSARNWRAAAHGHSAAGGAAGDDSRWDRSSSGARSVSTGTSGNNSSRSSSSGPGCSTQVLAALVEVAAGTGGQAASNRWRHRHQQRRERAERHGEPPLLLQGLAGDLFGPVAPDQCLVLLSELVPYLSRAAAVELLAAARGKLYSLQPQARALVEAVAGTAV
jgi:hypothetical protein